MKKLYKIRKEAVVAGVCAGIARYMGIDKTVVRVLYALISLATGIFLGIVFYIICMIVIPDEDNIN